MIRTEFQNGNLLDPTAKEAVKKSERRVLKKFKLTNHFQEVQHPWDDLYEKTSFLFLEYLKLNFLQPRRLRRN